MRNSFAGPLIAGLLVVAVAPAGAQSGTVSVDTRSSLYLAAGNTYDPAAAGGQPGISPPLVSLLAGTGRTLTVSATGTAAFCGAGACVATSPDGPAIGGTALTASGSLSGIAAPTSGFLAGVFLGSSLPGAAPVALDFNALTTDFATLAPALGQLFFIGNGSTAGGVQQRFVVPDAATRLYFGIADGFGFGGAPGYYDDNVGVYAATYAVSASVVPEPSTWLLLGTGLAALGAGARRRRR